jgi:hypothetical protein
MNCARTGMTLARASSVSDKSDINLRLSLELRGQPYVLTVTPKSFKLVLKGRRDGIELPWTAFLDEDAAMLSALHASIKGRLRSR